MYEYFLCNHSGHTVHVLLIVGSTSARFFEKYGCGCFYRYSGPLEPSKHAAHQSMRPTESRWLHYWRRRNRYATILDDSIWPCKNCVCHGNGVAASIILICHCVTYSIIIYLTTPRLIRSIHTKINSFDPEGLVFVWIVVYTASTGKILSTDTKIDCNT